MNEELDVNNGNDENTELSSDALGRLKGAVPEPTEDVTSLDSDQADEIDDGINYMGVDIGNAATDEIPLPDDLEDGLDGTPDYGSEGFMDYGMGDEGFMDAMDREMGDEDFSDVSLDDVSVRKVEDDTSLPEDIKMAQNMNETVWATMKNLSIQFELLLESTKFNEGNLLSDEWILSQMNAVISTKILAISSTHDGSALWYSLESALSEYEPSPSRIVSEVSFEPLSSKDVTSLTNASRLLAVVTKAPSLLCSSIIPNPTQESLDSSAFVDLIEEMKLDSLSSSEIHRLMLVVCEVSSNGFERWALDVSSAILESTSYLAFRFHLDSMDAFGLMDINVDLLHSECRNTGISGISSGEHSDPRVWPFISMPGLGPSASQEEPRFFPMFESVKSAVNGIDLSVLDGAMSLARKHEVMAKKLVRASGVLVSADLVWIREGNDESNSLMAMTFYEAAGIIEETRFASDEDKDLDPNERKIERYLKIGPDASELARMIRSLRVLMEDGVPTDNEIVSRVFVTGIKVTKLASLIDKRLELIDMLLGIETITGEKWLGNE